MAATKKTKVKHRTGTVRAKLEGIYKRAKGELSKARQVALKAGINKHTANRQLWLSERDSKYERPRSLAKLDNWTDVWTLHPTSTA